MRDRVFLNDGGPLIAVDRGLLGAWRGDGGNPSDYERACQADYPAGALKVGSGIGAVLGSREGISFAWWFEHERDAYLVGSAFGDEESDAILYARLREPNATDWISLAHVSLVAGTLVLFHAACAGDDLDLNSRPRTPMIGDALPFGTRPGPVHLQCCEVDLPDRGLYNVVRWAPAA